MKDDAVYTLARVAALASLAGLAAYVVLAVIAFTPPEPPLVEPGDASNHLGYVVRVRGTLSDVTECGYPAIVGHGAILVDMKGKAGESVEVAGVVAKTRCAGADVLLLVPLEKLLVTPTAQQPAQPPQQPTPSQGAGGNASLVAVP